MDDGYIYSLFLLLFSCVEWRLFCLISWWGVGFRWRIISADFRVKNPVGYTNLSLQSISARGNWVEKLAFCVDFIFLFVSYLFIYCLFVCLLITLRKQSEEGGRGAISVFWWVSSSLICSPVDLMQNVMQSLPSFLIYCCYCCFYG